MLGLEPQTMLQLSDAVLQTADATVSAPAATGGEVLAPQGVVTSLAPVNTPGNRTQEGMPLLQFHASPRAEMASQGLLAADGPPAENMMSSAAGLGSPTRGPAPTNTTELLALVNQPITPGLIPHDHSLHTPPRRPARSKKNSAAATCRSHRVQNQNSKSRLVGGGNNTMKLARKLIISKQGLAIAERGEDSGDDIVEKFETAFDKPLSPSQIGALTILAKGASRKGRAARSSAAAQLVSPIQWLNDVARRGVLFAVIRKYNVAAVCIQETKLQFIDLSIVRQCCGDQFSEFSFAPADGTRGGLLLAWKPSEFALANSFVSPWSVAAHGTLLKTQTPLNLITVYGPQSDADKLLFLQSLKDRLSDDMPNCLGALKSNPHLSPGRRFSLYADDLVIFAEPCQNELSSIKQLLLCFGEASGLFTNFAKSSIIPIQCQFLDLAPLAATF
ncbi:hypothetical protein ACQ4PT_026842 [Festuca glaucescens]